MRDVRISDQTMKEAVRSKALNLTFKKKLELAKLLDRLGVSVVEIEGIESAKADSLRIKSIASVVRNGILAVPVKLDGEDVEQVWNALKEAKRARLQVAAAVSPAQIEYIYRKKSDTMADAIVATVAKCAQYASDVEFIAEDATRTDIEYLTDVIRRAIEAGATTVTVCDAAGTMLPNEFAKFVEDLFEKVPELKDITLGISCSNELYMADACAVAAIIAGVGEVKATSYPLNLVSSDKLAKIMADKRDVCDARCSISLTELKRTISQIGWLCAAEDGTRPISFDPVSGEVEEEIALNARDDKETVMQSVRKLGYDLSMEDAANVYEAFLRIATKKDVVGSRELDAIIATAALQVPATYTVDNYSVTLGNTIKAVARVCLDKGDERLESVSMGDGPIDAICGAVEEITDKHFDLDDFQIQSITEGQEAMGETIVKLVVEGKVYSGRGISTDVIGASVRAIINAVNKIVYEEEN